MSEGNFVEKQTCWFVVCSGTKALSAPILSLPLFGLLTGQAGCMLTEWVVPSCLQPWGHTEHAIASDPLKGKRPRTVWHADCLQGAVRSWDFCSLTKFVLAEKEDSSFFVCNVEKHNLELKWVEWDFSCSLLDLLASCVSFHVTWNNMLIQEGRRENMWCFCKRNDLGKSCCSHCQATAFLFSLYQWGMSGFLSDLLE